LQLSRGAPLVRRTAPRSYIGVSKILQQLGIIAPGKIKSAGASIGAFVQVRASGAGQQTRLWRLRTLLDCVWRSCPLCLPNTTCSKQRHAHARRRRWRPIPSFPQGLDEGVGDHDEFISKHGPAFVQACQAQRNCFQTLDTEYAKLTAGVVNSNLDRMKKVLKGAARGRRRSKGLCRGTLHGRHA
jgi:hypothetical protein